MKDGREDTGKDKEGRESMRGKHSSRGNQIFTILFAVYIAAVLRITVFRSGFQITRMFQGGQWNLTLFQAYIPLIRQQNWHRFIYLFAGNIVWFVPFGVYLQYKKRADSILRISAYGFLFSLMIETLQYVFGTGYSELDDLILNTLGAGLGAGFIKYVMRCLSSNT